MPDRPAAGPPSSAKFAGAGDKASYYRLFSAYVLALFCTGIATVALAVLAFELEGDDSGAVIGTALSIKMLAYVGAAPVAAALTEGLQRRPLLVALDLVRAGSMIALPFVTAVWQVYALVFVFALASATFTLAYQPLVPYLLPAEADYTRSLARSRVAAELESSVSPLLAGALLLLLGATGLFVAATAGFLASAVLVRAAGLPAPRRAPGAGVWSKVLRGPRLFLATPDLRGLLALDVAVAAATAMVLVNTVVIVQGGFDLDTRATAVAFAVFGLGAMVGAVALPRVLRALPERAVMLGGAAAIAVALLLGPLVASYGGLLALWLALGLGASLALTPAAYLIRRVGGHEDLQTLFAAQFSISNAALLVGYAAAGWLGATLGMTASFLALGLVAAAAAMACAWLWPRRQA